MAYKRLFILIYRKFVVTIFLKTSAVKKSPVENAKINVWIWSQYDQQTRDLWDTSKGYFCITRLGKVRKNIKNNGFWSAK